MGAPRGVRASSPAWSGANLTMVYALVTHDFSVKYVAQVGSRATPLIFTIVVPVERARGLHPLLGPHPRHLPAAPSRCVHRNEHARYMSLALGTMLARGRLLRLPHRRPGQPLAHVSRCPDGPGPNPLLQNHILMVIHPPMLYLGYVGMTVPSASRGRRCCAARLATPGWRPLRRWMLMPWMFLTIGIILGVWWAYEVLGWGGYWAWDPVENASLPAVAHGHRVHALHDGPGAQADAASCGR